MAAAAVSLRMPPAMRSTVEAVKLGTIIRRLRQERKWTKTKLAQRANLTPTYIALIERGHNLPSLPVLFELAEVLDADPVEIVRELLTARHRKQAAATVR